MTQRDILVLQKQVGGVWGRRRFAATPTLLTSAVATQRSVTNAAVVTRYFPIRMRPDFMAAHFATASRALSVRFARACSRIRFARRGSPAFVRRVAGAIMPAQTMLLRHTFRATRFMS